MGEVEVDGKVFRHFLLITGIESIDSRVRVVLAEDAHAGAERNSTAGRNRNDIGPCRRLGGSAKTTKGKRGGAGYPKLLRAVIGDRPNLRQHVLTGVENAVAGAQDGFSLLRDVPGKSNARLKLFLGAVERSIRGKVRIGQERGIGRLRRGNDRVGEYLRFPSQPV